MQLSVGILPKPKASYRQLSGFPFRRSGQCMHSPTPVFQTSRSSSDLPSLGRHSWTLNAAFMGCRLSLGKRSISSCLSIKSYKIVCRNQAHSGFYTQRQDSQIHQNNCKKKKNHQRAPITLPGFSNSESPLVQAEENGMKKEMNHHGMAN